MTVSLDAAPGRRPSQTEFGLQAGKSRYEHEARTITRASSFSSTSIEGRWWGLLPVLRCRRSSILSRRCALTRKPLLGRRRQHRPRLRLLLLRSLLNHALRRALTPIDREVRQDA